MRKKKPKMKTVTNENGIKVNKACISCDHKDATRSCKRSYCCLTHEEVDRYHLCKKWQMSEQLKMAGSSRGVVRDIKTKEVVIQ